ncbi:amino acid ABC transporter permease [Brachybacterium huguangmaarense]
MSATAATRVLFDEPGPRGRRRILILSILSALLIAGIIALGLYQFGVNGQLAADRWAPFTRPDYIRFLGQGAQGTFTSTAVAAVFAFPLALLLALGRLSSLRPLARVSTAWIEVFRSIPMLLVVYFFLLALPGAPFHVTFPRFWMLVIPMILVSSASTAEVFRAGIRAVDKGQGEAAVSLGLSHAQSLRYVVVPQAIRLVLPSLILALVSLLKDSTLGFVVSYNELQYQGKSLVAYTHFLVQTYLIVAFIYVALNFLLTQLAHWLDRRMQRRAASAGPSLVE